MSVVSGLMYSASLPATPLVAAPQSLVEIITGPNVPILIHGIRLDFSQYATQQNTYLNFAFQYLAPVTAAGISIVPSPQHPRNTTPPATTVQALVTTPARTVLSTVRAETFNAVGTYERDLKWDQRLRIAAGSVFAISLISSTGGFPPFIAIDITFEE